MSYGTAEAFRMALEQRLGNRARESGTSLDRLRRRVLFERIMARLEATQAGRWVLKGGMAMEVRLRDEARLTKDIDLGLRDQLEDPSDIQERLSEALDQDPFGDRFRFTVQEPRRLGDDRAGTPTWRLKVSAHLAGTIFGVIQLDISPREHELDETERLQLPNSLDFAGLPPTEIEIIDTARHAAEKLHAMLRDYGDRENSRVRDLVDLIILMEHDLLDADTVAERVKEVWGERDGAAPPSTIPPPPDSWANRYERLIEHEGLEAPPFETAIQLIDDLWTQMFPTAEA